MAPAATTAHNPHMIEATDQLLVSRVRDGEPEAWEELIGRFAVSYTHLTLPTKA